MSAFLIHKIKWKTPEGCFFLLLLLYLIVNMINTSETSGGGVLNQVISGLIIVFCTVRVLFRKNSVLPQGKSVYKILGLFLIYITTRFVVMLFVDYSTAMSSMRSLLTILFWGVCLLFCMNEFGRTDPLDIERLSRILIVLSFIGFIYSILITRQYLQSIDEIGAVNSAGSAYMLVPLILLFLKGRLKHLGYLLCLVVCAWSQKRQCVLGFALVSVFVIVEMLKDYFRTFRYVGIIYLLLALAMSTKIMNVVFSGIIERQEYLNENSEISDSGRSVLREFALDGFNDAKTPKKIFGGGPGTGGRYVEQRLGIFVAPHCGFIEVLCDYGIIGFVIYMLFFLSLLKTSLRFPRGSIKRKLLLGIFLAWVMSNLVSHAGRIWTMYFCIAIGCILFFDYPRENNPSIN